MRALDAEFRLANAWRIRGHVDRAMAGYREILRVDPGHLPAVWKLGDLLEARGDLGEAETVLRDAVTRHPEAASLHKRFINVLSRREGWPAALAYYGLDRQDARPVDPSPDEVLGCAVVRNERARLPYWLTYHRQRGIRRFLVVDNGSSDDTLPYLLGQPDVHVWRSLQSYHAANYGTAWLEVLLRQYGVGRWCLIADADELFCYPDADDTSLPELCRRLDRKGKRACTAILLDLYAATPIRDTHYAPGADFRAVCRYFDRRFSHRRVQRHTLEGPQTIDVGGVRERVFGGSGDYYLSKVPLLRYDADCVLSPHWTNLAAAVVAVERGCLLHFKYFASFPTSVSTEVERKEHYGHLFQYEAYADAVARNATLTLFDPEHSVEFLGTRQLLELGILRRDPDDPPLPPSAESGSGDAYVRFRLANLWRAKGKLERAVAGYEDVIRTHPDYLPAQLELGDLYDQLGRRDEAAAHYRRAVAANPDAPSLRARLDALVFSGVPHHDGVIPEPRVARLPEAGARRVLVYTDCADAYGAEQIGHLVMLHLVRHGYAVTCAQPAADHPLIAERARAGIRHVWLAANEDASDDAQVEALFATVAPDLVVFNDGSPLANLAAKETAARRRVPFVLVTHCVSAAWADECAGQLPRLPPLYRAAQAVVAVSEENLVLLRQRFGLPSDLGQVIVNGRPASYFAARDLTARRDLRAALGIPDDAVVVFTAARLEAVKGYQYQVAALKQLQRRAIWPRMRFLWAGTGTLEGQLRAVVAEGGMATQVRFLGARSDVPALLDASDVFLLPSEFEGMPLALMEAMAKGVPTMATAVSGIPEALGDVGQLLPDPRVDPRATVAALVATLEQWAADPDLRAAQGRACRARAEAAFGADRMLAAYLEIVRR